MVHSRRGQSGEGFPANLPTAETVTSVVRVIPSIRNQLSAMFEALARGLHIPVGLRSEDWSSYLPVEHKKQAVEPEPDSQFIFKPHYFFPLHHF